MALDAETEWLNWFRGAGACGLRYRRVTAGYPHAQLGPMMIRGTSTLVAGESGHHVTTNGVTFWHPEAANDN